MRICTLLEPSGSYHWSGREASFSPGPLHHFPSNTFKRWNGHIPEDEGREDGYHRIRVEQTRHIPSECLGMSSPAISYLRVDQGVPSITCFLDVRNPSLNWVRQPPWRTGNCSPHVAKEDWLTASLQRAASWCPSLIVCVTSCCTSVFIKYYIVTIFPLHGLDSNSSRIRLHFLMEIVG